MSYHIQIHDIQHALILILMIKALVIHLHSHSRLIVEFPVKSNMYELVLLLTLDVNWHLDTQFIIDYFQVQDNRDWVFDLFANFLLFPFYKFYFTSSQVCKAAESEVGKKDSDFDSKHSKIKFITPIPVLNPSELNIDMFYLMKKHSIF